MSETHSQVNKKGIIVNEKTQLLPNKKTLHDEYIKTLFSNDCWEIENFEYIDNRNYKIKLKSAICTYDVNVFFSTVRDEDRQPDEYKMQLGNTYPSKNETMDSKTMVLGIYLMNTKSESENVNDLIERTLIVDYDAIDISFPTNPSVRGARTRYLQQAQIYGYVRTEKCTIMKPSFLFYHIYAKQNNGIKEVNRTNESVLATEINFVQQIYYGTPGTGKSYEVKKVTGEIDDKGNEHSLPNVFRTTFHPDTDYASFVGCYKPVEKEAMKYGLNGNATIPFSDANGDPIKEDYISYAFEPQVFTEAYIYAYNHSDENTYLVIEEINRGNCAQIFGDLFQLLDRKDDGTSEYKIKADSSLAKYLREGKDDEGNSILENKEGIVDGKLCLPSNLSILATMNTSDQSLFPMDSAFKRRWDWKYVPIKYDEEKSSDFKIEIGNHQYSWIKFLEVINPKIQKITSSEDKMMGNFFIKGSIDSEKFKSKIMFYLWNEVLKDEVENNNYFLYGKNGDEKQKFMFSDLYGNNAESTLASFFKTLDIEDEGEKDYGDQRDLDSNQNTWYKSLWTEVKQKLNDNGYKAFTSVPDSQYYQKGIGITGMSVIASVSKKRGDCWVGAYIEAKQANILYPKVQLKQTDLESKLGTLQWIEDKGAYRRVNVETHFDDLDIEENRKAVIDWVVDNLQNFYDSFKIIAAEIRNQ